MASSMLDEDLRPVEVTVDNMMIRVRFQGGLELATPVAQYPRLRDADPAKRIRWELVGRGDGIHWPDVDEDISLRGLFSAKRKMPESPLEQVPVLISDLLKTTGRLNSLFDGKRPFTPDGHLVGSIGEVVAEYVYDLLLEPCSTPLFDAYTKANPSSSVQIKLTGERGKSFGVRWPQPEDSKSPDVLICMRMTAEGFEEIYNGPFPIELLEDRAKSSNGQVALQASALRKMNPKHLPQVRTFDSVNRWFKASPELADVA